MNFCKFKYNGAKLTVLVKLGWVSWFATHHRDSKCFSDVTYCYCCIVCVTATLSYVALAFNDKWCHIAFYNTVKSNVTFRALSCMQTAPLSICVADCIVSTHFQLFAVAFLRPQTACNLSYTCTLSRAQDYTWQQYTKRSLFQWPRVSILHCFHLHLFITRHFCPQHLC